MVPPGKPEKYACRTTEWPQHASLESKLTVPISGTPVVLPGASDIPALPARPGAHPGHRGCFVHTGLVQWPARWTCPERSRTELAETLIAAERIVPASPAPGGPLPGAGPRELS